MHMLLGPYCCSARVKRHGVKLLASNYRQKGRMLQSSARAAHQEQSSESCAGTLQHV